MMGELVGAKLERTRIGCSFLDKYFGAYTSGDGSLFYRKIDKKEYEDICTKLDEEDAENE